MTQTIFSRLRSNIFWNITTEFFVKGSVFIGTIYLTRILGTEAFGWFVYIQSIAMLLWVFSDLGISLYGIKEVAQNKSSLTRIVNPMVTVRAICGVALWVVASTVVISLNNVSGELQIAIVAGLLYVFAYAVYPDWILKGLEQFKALSIGGVFYSFYFLLGIAIFVKESEDLARALFVWSTSYAISAIFLFYFIQKNLIRVKIDLDPNHWKIHLNESMYVVFAGFLSTGYQHLPVLLLGSILGMSELGIFSPAFRLVTIVSAIGFYVASGFFPILADLYAREGEGYKTASQFMGLLFLIFGVIFALFLAINSELIISILFGMEYVASAEYLRVLAWIVPIQLVRYRYTFALRATDLQKYQFIPFAIALPVLATVGLFLLWNNAVDLKSFCIFLLFAEIIILAQFVYLSGIADKHRERRNEFS